MGDLFDLINFNLSDFIFQLINIAILIYFLNKFLFKRVMGMINERNKEVSGLYKDIDDAWTELEKKDKKYSELLKNVNSESEAIIEKAKEESKAIKESSLKEARETAEKEMNNELKTELMKEIDLTINKKYGITFDKNFDKRLYCSQFVYDVFKKAGNTVGREIDLDSDGGSWVMPFDIMRSNILENVILE